MKSPLERAAPEWTDHPVDVIKWFAERAGRKLDPETEARLRAICDEPIEADAACLSRSSLIVTTIGAKRGRPTPAGL